MSMGKALRLLRAAAITLLLCGGVGIGTWSLLWYQYRNTLPRSPEPSSGRVVPRSSSYTAPDGTKFETHWYENVRTGQRVEFKTKLP